MSDSKPAAACNQLTAISSTRSPIVDTTSTRRAKRDLVDHIVRWNVPSVVVVVVVVSGFKLFSARARATITPSRTRDFSFVQLRGLNPPHVGRACIFMRIFRNG